jgi:iron(III) transport system ATP-binding protein
VRAVSDKATAATDGAVAPPGQRGVALSIQKVTKRFGDFTAVDSLSIDVERGSFVTLVGPSGCGKTTLLRMVAGLETPTSGTIVLSGREVFNSELGIDLAANRRNLGMVFQSYALWPHMTAFDNVAFPLTRSSDFRRSLSRRQRHRVLRTRVLDILQLVGCDHLADRYPSEMSGGQQQRVAVARALVNSPEIVLMDEPLSNLDAKLRSRLRFDLRTLQQELGFTAVYVTHDRAEALSMADEVVVLRDGIIEQQGSPFAVYERPSSAYVSDFLGDHNLVDGTITRDGASVFAETFLGRIDVSDLAVHVDSDVIQISVPREAITVARCLPHDAGSGRDEALVVGVPYCGWFSELLIRLPDGEEVTSRIHGETPVRAGDHVVLRVDRAVSVSGRSPEPEA